MDNFLGQITLFACGFPPRGWAQCQGQLLSIQQNTALFSLLGTTFGGDGRVTFALPDLRGRAPNGQGQAPGLSDYVMGQAEGSETVTLTSQTIPSHNHALPAFTSNASATNPNGAQLAQGDATGTHGHTTRLDLYHSGAPNVSLAGPQVAPFPGGSSLGHSNMQPSLAATWCIALTGNFPPRP